MIRRMSSSSLEAIISIQSEHVHTQEVSNQIPQLSTESANKVVGRRAFVRPLSLTLGLALVAAVIFAYAGMFQHHPHHQHFQRCHRSDRHGAGQ